MSFDPAFPFLIAVIHSSKGSDYATIMQLFWGNYYELPARNTLNNTHENGRFGIYHGRGCLEYYGLPARNMK